MAFAIAITGGIGAGKSQLSQVLRSMGYCVWDADTLAREVLFFSHVEQEVKKVFGNDIFLSPGQLDRKRMSDIVFSHPELKSKLEQILHPEIAQLFAQRKNDLEKFANNIWIFYEASLIFENNKEKQFDACVLVTANKDIRIQRLTMNRKMTLEQIEKIMNAQLDDEEKKKRTEYLIDNSHGIAELETQCFKLIKMLAKSLSQTKKV